MAIRIALVAGLTAATVVGSGTAGAAMTLSVVEPSGAIHGCNTNAAINGSHALLVQDPGDAASGRIGRPRRRHRGQ